MSEIATTESDKTARFGGVRAVENLPHSCSCGARWGGYTTAHCGATNCHLTFSGVSTFTQHRRGGICTAPAEVGMSLVPGRPYECWGFPGEVAE